MSAAHPLATLGYDFDVPLLDGDHVTDDTGTGFVHTAPGHGADDYNIWIANQKALHERGIDTTIPFTVDADGVLTKDAPGFDGKRVLKENGDKGDANDAVIKALADAGNIIARGRLKHQYPHSWRSKKPVIFRNTPQWFIAMDKPLAPLAPSGPGRLRGCGGIHAQGSEDRTLRQVALAEIDATEWVPETGQNRITGMIANRPDWVVSRQRAWGVPITVFRYKEPTRSIPGRRHPKSRRGCQRRASPTPSPRKGADVWFEAGRQGALPQGLVPTLRSRQVGAGPRRARRLVRLQARRTPSRSKTPSTSPASPASSACATAAPTASCISKARTSIAAGSTPRCSNPAARAAARPSTSC